MFLDIRDKSKNALGMGISTVFKIFGDLLFHGNQEYPWFRGQDPNRFFFLYFVIPNSLLDPIHLWLLKNEIYKDKNQTRVHN